MTTQELYNITPDSYGWRHLPNRNRVLLGNGVQLGNDVRLWGGTTSIQLNELMRQVYIKSAPAHIFWKWITKQRQSPGWGSSKIINYPVGAIVEEPQAKISDQQCGVGLHVFRVGYRPEWVGLINPAHDLICIDVEVKSEDICFAGLPTMDAKIRVRKLKVLT